jgi:hypothetical protein
VEPRGKLRAIPFDKLIMIFGRSWDEMFSRTGANFKTRDPSSITEQEHQQAVTFPVPFAELPGKHGAGRAVNGNNRPPEFLVSVLYRLRQEDILPYFDIFPPPEAPNKANDYRTTIEPALSSASDDTLLEDFTAKEREALRDLINALKRLRVEEMRALGTHQDFEKTVADIKREFRWMQSWIDEVAQNLKAGRAFLIAAQEVLEYADEACRKSERNRFDYAKARDIVKAELTQPEVKRAFLDCQKSPEEIWERDEMKDLARHARRAHAQAHYLERIAYWSELNRQHSSLHNWENALEEVSAQLKREDIHGLPNSLDQVLVKHDSSDLRENVKERLLVLIAELKNP